MTEVVLQQIRSIEKAALMAWPPERIVAVDGWLLRSSSDVSNRTNSVSTVDRNTGVKLIDSVRKVERFYKDQAKPAGFQVIDASQPNQLDNLLEKCGYGVVTPSDVLIRPSADIDADQSIELLTRPTPSVMNVLSDPSWSSDSRAQRAALFNRIRRPHVFAVMFEAELPVSGGLCVIDDGFAGIFAMRTQNAHRGRGHARAVLCRLLDWAAKMGAHTYYLQVERDNEPAIALYRRLGFNRAYTYWYRKRS